MPTPAANRSRYSLTIQGIRDDIRVTGFSGHAEISGLYTYDISVASKRANFELKKWLDLPATLTLHGDPDRHIHGLIIEAGHTGQGREFTDYRITIVPRLWRLTQSKNHRIFQDKNPNQIITLLLKEHGIQGADFQDHTSDAPARPYCVQYGETDFAFISRLMSEEGWHFHFHHKKDRHILVLADKNSVFASKSGAQAIRYMQETSRAHGEDCIHTLDFRHQITGGAVRLGDFDFTKPGLALREAATGRHNSLEHYDHPGLFDDPAIGKKRADLRLQQSECLRQSVHMECHVTTFEAGQWFNLHSHPNPALNQQYLVTRIGITGTQTQAYGEGAASSEEPFRCTLTCIPAKTTFRPPHQWRKPTIKGPHSAVVTGPKGEEIYTDQHGRIKVQFHWDREAQADETTSCWVRVNQPVAGVQWGGVTIPRIGQEVIIEFEHGDPDRPIMVGRVYNGQNLPPYPLPAHKTRSVLKTLTSPGGGGFHEIRIDDKKGSEQIFLRAEKDMDLRVKNTKRTQIGRDRHAISGNEDFTEVNGDLHHAVGGALNEKIGLNLSVSVGQDLQLKVSGALVIQAGNTLHIKAGSKAVLEGGMSLSVKGGAGVITLAPSGVTIVGPLVRINEGGGGGSAKAANPTVPGQPGEADNAVPGAKLRAASGSVTPLPAVIDFDKARSQLASLAQAKTFSAPLVEACPECLLNAAASTGSGAEAVSSSATDIPDDCLDLICIDADGSPAQDLPYVVTLANGSQRTGKLDAEGKAHLTGLTPGAVTVEYQPDDNEAEIKAIRSDIAKALNDIIQSEKAESAKIQAEYEQKSVVGQWWEDKKAEARGVGSAIGGLFSLLKEVNDLTPQQQVNNALKVAWESWRYSDERPYTQRFLDNLTESQFKEAADVLGFDPRSITREKMAQTWAMANFIWDDAETQKLLLQFAKDFITAQHKLEILEGAGQVAGDIAIDILITALTVGAGATVAAGRKFKLLDKFKKLGPLFEKLAEAIKKRRKRRSKSGQTGSEVAEQLERPEAIHPENNKKKSNSPTPGFRIGDIESAPRYVKLTSQFKNTSPTAIKQFYADLDAQGIDYKSLIESGISKHGLSPDEAQAVFGYTTKLFYRDLNQTLDAGGSAQAKELAELIKSGLEKMPKSGSTQYRGIRLDNQASTKNFDAKYGLGNTVDSAFWSTAPNRSDAYAGSRNLTIVTSSARDISDLAFGVHFHDKVGKMPYSSETIIPPGVRFRVIRSDGKGNITLKQE